MAVVNINMIIPDRFFIHYLNNVYPVNTVYHIERQKSV